MDLDLYGTFTHIGPHINITFLPPYIIYYIPCWTLFYQYYTILGFPLYHILPCGHSSTFGHLTHLPTQHIYPQLDLDPTTT